MPMGMNFPLANILARMRVASAFSGENNNEDDYNVFQRYGQDDTDPNFTVDAPNAYDPMEVEAPRVYDPIYRGAPRDISNDFDYSKAVSENPTIQAYRERLGQVPTWQDYAPSQGRRIGAALISAADALATGDPAHGVALAQPVIDQPYRQGVADWQLGTNALEKASDLENDRLKALANYSLGQGRIAETSRANDIRAQNTQRMVEAENLRHQDRMAKLKADSADDATVRAETERHNQEMERISSEQANTAAAHLTIDREAEARKQKESDARIAKGDKPKTISPSQQDRADKMATEKAVLRMQNEYPDFKPGDFFDTADNGDLILNPKPEAGFFGSQDNIDTYYQTLQRYIEEERNKILNFNSAPGNSPGGMTDYDMHGNRIKR